MNWLLWVGIIAAWALIALAIIWLPPILKHLLTNTDTDGYHWTTKVDE